jgi:hypothetical protein
MKYTNTLCGQNAEFQYVKVGGTYGNHWASKGYNRSLKEIEIMETFLVLRLEVLTPVVMKGSIFWDITPCSPLKINRCFWGTYSLHLQGRRISRARNQHDSRAYACWNFWLYLKEEGRERAQFSHIGSPVGRNARRVPIGCHIQLSDPIAKSTGYPGLSLRGHLVLV